MAAFAKCIEEYRPVTPGAWIMQPHSAAKQPSLRFRNGLGWSLGNVLGLIYIDLVEAQRSYFFNFIEQF